VAHRRKRQPTPGERFTATVSAIGAVLLPFTAIGGDAYAPFAERPVGRAQPVTAPDDVDPGVGADGRLRTDPGLSPQLFAELHDPGKLTTGVGPWAQVPDGRLGIPGSVMDAYLRAERTLARTQPGCGAHWSVLAAIGRIESGHARDGRVDAAGTTVSPILGPELSGGPGIAAIRDTDGGRLDGDTAWDRAVGPMQFIPSTWKRYAVDGNGDGLASPHNVGDAALATGNYLCAGGANLRDAAQLAAAIFRYNPSEDYVRTVLAWAARYASGVIPLPPDSPPGDVPPASLANSVPPVGGSPNTAPLAIAAGPAPAAPPAPGGQPVAPAPPPAAPAPAPAPAPPPPAPAPAPAPTPAPPPPAPAPTPTPAPPPPPPPPPPPSSSTPPPPPPPSSSTPPPSSTTPA
jgi:hypothetical protein